MAKATRKRPERPAAAESNDPAPTGARPLPVVKVVGVSAAGKSTLAQGLRRAGYDARPVSQEHSHVPTLWKQFGVPQALIYLDVSLATQQARRSDVPWSAAGRDEEVTRLADARAHADLVIDTSAQSSASVCAIALAFLRDKGMRRAPTPLPPLGETGAPGRE